MVLYHEHSLPFSFLSSLLSLSPALIVGCVNLYQSFEPSISLEKIISFGDGPVKKSLVKQALFRCLLEVVGISVLWGYSGDVGSG